MNYILFLKRTELLEERIKVLCVVCVKSECYVCVLYVHISKRKRTVPPGDPVRFFIDLVPVRGRHFDRLIDLFCSDKIRILAVMQILAAGIIDTCIIVTCAGHIIGNEEYLTFIGQTDLHLVVEELCAK